MACVLEPCICKYQTDLIFRTFFDVWDHQFTPTEEAQMQKSAEWASGQTYDKVMTGDQKNFNA